MRAVLDHIDTHSADIQTFWFTPEGKFRFNAGEFAEFYLPHEHTDSRGDKRWFTISSAPNSKQLGITVRFAAQNGSSFKTALMHMKPGDELFVGETLGDFVLPKDATIPLLFVAVGIGITPMMSIVRAIAANKEKRDITLVHMASHREDLLAADIFSKHTTYHQLIKSNVYPDSASLSQAALDIVLAAAAEKQHPYIYLAGPKNTVQQLAHALHAHGISRDQLAVDLFTGAIDLPKD